MATRTVNVVDTMTDAPELFAPATGTTTGSPVAVSFKLPEAALAGSVQLEFDDGVAPRSLVLAASQEGYGAHAFSFDPSDPVLSSAIASGSAIPDGTYTVTLSCQDALGNPAATAAATGVVVDTTGPAGGIVMLTPPSPVDAAAALSVTFAGWTDAQAPLSYEVLVDGIAVDIPGGSVTVNFTGPSAAGAHTLKGRVFDSLGNGTEVTQVFTVLTPQESWRRLYFGTPDNAGDAEDTADPDGDGDDNRFEFVAGLVPTDAASRFSIDIKAVAGQPAQKNIVFSPLVLTGGRTYTVKFRLDLATGPWTTLTGTTQSDLGAQRTVTDLNATGAQKYYNVEITKP